MSATSGFVWPVRVYIEDTDAGGIVFYANYLKYMERARTEWARSKGVQLRASLQDGISYVVHSLTVNYHQSARLDDELLVSAEISAYGRTWFEFEQVVSRTTDEARLVSAKVKVASTDLQSGRARRLDRALMYAIESACTNLS